MSDPMSFVYRYEDALANDDFAGRAEALAAITGHWPVSKVAIEQLLASGDERRIADAAGVLAHVRLDQHLAQQVASLYNRLPEGEARTAVGVVTQRLRLAPHPGSSSNSVVKEGTLLGGMWEPFTEKISYVRADLLSVLSVIRSAGKSQVKEQEGPLGDLLEQLDPWQMPPQRYLIVAGSNGWIACFGQSGNTAVINPIAASLGADVVATGYAPDVVRGGKHVRHGYTEFSYDDMSRRRYLQVSRQPSGWEFVQRGEPLEFEDLDRFHIPDVRDRFNLAILLEYCRHFGISRNDAGFYRYSGAVVERPSGKGRKPARVMSSAEWRRQHGVSSQDR